MKGITFKTSGSIIAVDDADIDKRIASATRAFGTLRQAVDTKRKAYQSCVLSVLLYGGECWTP